MLNLTLVCVNGQPLGDAGSDNLASYDRATRRFVSDGIDIAIRCGGAIGQSIARVYNTHDAESRADQAVASRWLAPAAYPRQPPSICSSDKSGHDTVPHPKKDLGKGLVLAILKQAGLK